MSFFLRHFAGFLIQIGGGMMLCLLPFDDKAFRYPRKWVIWGYWILSLLTSLGFPLVMSIPAFSGNDYRSMIANLYMAFVVLAFTVLYFYIIRAATIKKAVVLVLVLFYAATQYLLVNLVTPLFPGGVLPDVYPPLTLAAYAVTAAIMLPFAVVLMYRALRSYLSEIDIKEIKREFVTVLIATALYFVLLVIYASRPDGLLADFWWWIIPPLLLTAAVLCFFYWTLFTESVRRKRDHEKNKALEIRQMQYDSITNDIELTRLMRHDMRHHLNHIADLLDEGKESEIKDYLAHLTVQVSKRETMTFCQNDTVNALLQYYTGIATMKNIRCDITAECGELSVTATDLTVLLGNTMENAIRACESPCQGIEENRCISVSIGSIGNTLAIQVTNSCNSIHPSGRYRMDGSFLPAAAFASGRKGGGLGLYSLEHTAAKYGGSASFRFDEKAKTFTTHIWVNQSPSK